MLLFPATSNYGSLDHVKAHKWSNTQAVRAVISKLMEGHFIPRDAERTKIMVDFVQSLITAADGATTS
jgi:hypothetical protein